MTTAPPRPPIDATAIAFSGFFLREDAWSCVRPGFARFTSVDARRDDPALTLAGYVDAALAAIAATPPPHVLLAHSFGGWLAAAVVERLPAPPRALVLLGALGVAPGLSAAEHASAAGDAAMASVCGLDLEAGTIRLHDPAGLRRLLGTGDPYDPRHAAWPHLAPDEPAALLFDTLAAGPRPRRPAPRRLYVLARDDALCDAAAQRRAAATHDATVLERPGGHLAALRDLAWIDEIA